MRGQPSVMPGRMALPASKPSWTTVSLTISRVIRDPVFQSVSHAMFQ